MKHRYLKDVTTLAFDAEKCIGCGRCTEVCPHGVFEIDERKALIVDKDACMLPSPESVLHDLRRAVV